MTNPWYSETAVVIAMIAITAFFLIGGAPKVTWLARGDIAAAVPFMVATASVFFLIADQIMRLVVTSLLGAGS
jgi:hypothetical protein